MNHTLRRKSYSQRLRFMLITSIGIDKGKNCEKCPSYVHRMSRLSFSLSLSPPIDNNKPRLTELSAIFIFEESAKYPLRRAPSWITADHRVSLLLVSPKNELRSSAVARYVRVRLTGFRPTYTFAHFPQVRSGTYPRRLPVGARENERGVESAIRASTSEALCVHDAGNALREMRLANEIVAFP